MRDNEVRIIHQKNLFSKTSAKVFLKLNAPDEIVANEKAKNEGEKKKNSMHDSSTIRKVLTICTISKCRF